MIKNYKNWLNETVDYSTPRPWLFGTVGPFRWKEDADGKIVISGDIKISKRTSNIEFIPVQFANHSEKFTIEDCPRLKSLKGCPEVVKEFRVVDCPDIQTLEGGPKEAKAYHIQNLGIKNLIGSPEVVTSVFNCANNDFLESFEGAPEKIEGGDNIFYAVHCPKIKTIFGASTADAYFIDTETIENSVEKEWLIKQNENLDLIHSWLKSKMLIEEFLIKKRGLVSGKKYGL